MATALKLGIPDRVPTFELEFQLSEELIGKSFLTEHELEGLSASEVDRKIAENAQFMIQVYDRLEHDAICIQYLNEEHTIQTSGPWGRNLCHSGRGWHAGFRLSNRG